MTRRLTKSQKVLIVIGPSLLVAAGYFLVFHMPLRREGSRQSAEAIKLGTKMMRFDYCSAKDRLAALTEERQLLTNQLNEYKQFQSRFVSNYQSTESENDIQASMISVLLSHLQSYGLQCTAVVNIPRRNTVNRDTNATRSQTAEISQSVGVEKVTVELQGSFLAMQAALNGLDTNSLTVQIEAVRMDEKAVVGVNEVSGLATIRKPENAAAPRGPSGAVAAQDNSNIDSPASESGNRLWTVTIALSENGR